MDTMEPMIRKASAKWTGELKSGSGVVSSNSGVLNSTPYSFHTRFEDQPGTNPEELIAAAHAACFSMALSAMLGANNFPPNSVATNADLSLENVDGAWTITKIHLTTSASVPNIDNETFQKIANDAKANCPISRVLNTDISLTASLD